MSQKKLHEDSSTAMLCTDKMMVNKNSTFPQYIATILATLSAFSMGTCLSWSSPALLLLQQPNSRISITPSQGSWIASLLTLGAFFGAIPAGNICKRIGPKRTLQILSFPIFGSWIILAFSECVWGLYVARFLVGLAVGAVSVAAPMYVAQLAEPKIRGSLGSFFQLQITAGILFEYILGGSVGDFHILALISSIVPVVFLATYSFMPESPVHLSSIGKSKQARINMQWLRGVNYDVQDEITRIEEHIKKEKFSRTKITDLTNCKATSGALVVSLGLMLFQQLSGINAVLFYTAEIFKESGSSISPSSCAILIGSVQVAATYLSTVLIDRTGRRILLIISASVMSLCLGALGLYFYLKDIHDVSKFSVMPLLTLAVYVIVFSIGFGPIPWIMMGEIFLPKMVGIASSVSAACNWLLAFTVTKLFQNMLDVLGPAHAFNVFALICAVGCIFVLFKVPETKGKDINEILNHFGANSYAETQKSNDEEGVIRIDVR